MNVPLSDALHGAHGIVTAVTGGTTMIAVWHGSHTVNFYRQDQDTDGRVTLQEFTCASIGDYETGEVTREDFEEAARDTIREHIQES